MNRLFNIAAFVFLIVLSGSAYSQCVMTLVPDSTEGKDAGIFSISCSSSYGSLGLGCEDLGRPDHYEQFIGAWTFFGTPGIERELIEFDLDSLAAVGCTVSRATLQFFHPGVTGSTPTCGSGSTHHPCNDNTMILSRVLGAWDEATVTWNTQPAVASTTPGVDYITIPNEDTPYTNVSMEITDMVNYWLANPTQNFGMMAKLQSEVYYSDRIYASSDHVNPLKRPRLVLELVCADSCNNLLTGKVFDDTDSDCIKDPSESGLESWLIRITPGPFYATTDASGNWAAYVNGTGPYTIEQILPTTGGWTAVCPTPYSYTVSGLTSGSITPGLDFAAHTDSHCPDLWVDVAGFPLRPCHLSPYNVEYCNLGSAPQDSVIIQLNFDPALIVVSSSIPWMLPQTGTLYEFFIGTLNPGDCGNFSLDIMTACYTHIGEVYCVEAVILPEDSCIFEPLDSCWDKSSIAVTGDCVGDSIACFTITNMGTPVTGDMDGPSDYRIYDNGLLVYSGTFILCGGCDTVICWPAYGHTISLQADQRPCHPGHSHPNDHVDGCGDTLGGTPLPGVVLMFPEDDEDDNIEIFCEEVVSSYDPNDKRNFPVGFEPQHYITADDELEYVIRFQNTGNDTAFNVVILDTLSSFLDPATMRPGASSHPYTWRIYGGGVIEFTFADIMLPDSNVNEPLSHGLVKFNCLQMPGNTPGTVIENRASIYFDFNAPVLTDKVFNTVWEGQVNTDPRAPVGSRLSVFPNPTTGEINVVLDEHITAAGCQLLDNLGRVVLVPSLNQMGRGRYSLNMSSLPPGIYFLRMNTVGGDMVARVVKL